MQVADDVFSFAGTDVNFVLWRDRSELTLVDSGYPGDLDAVEAAVHSLHRRLEDVRAILITHAHIDHLGAAIRLHERVGAPLLLGSTEVAHARRDYLEQLTPLRLTANLWRPGMIAWTSRIVRAGAMHDAPAPAAQAFDTDGPLDVPGRPVPVATPGHTSGHTAYQLPSVGVVITGDALVTGHPLSRHVGPQLLPRFFNHDEHRTLSALDALEGLDADCVVPGHGAVHRGPVRDAVDRARAHAASGHRP
ncbi:MBL fold metallo-hydrolase [Leekyejoonella antrihumi]|uniref:MBL fold metallo-hydrolase n=1 Tax=Leekyejoonella antrihumi TaxID=1660198 RepID=A0A563E3D5_9MICO|nr:MBL fold metallo-hydrolase [Leekyejoonella antrihumi]TWP36819.1 MBL fold metallo-hydrolase [Leekyejoonella antrihumi]